MKIKSGEYKPLIDYWIVAELRSRVRVNLIVGFTVQSEPIGGAETNIKQINRDSGDHGVLFRLEAHFLDTYVSQSRKMTIGCILLPEGQVGCF